MPATTEINIANFEEIQSQTFDKSKKYLPLGEEVLREHQFGQQIIGLIKTISGGNHNTDNVLNLELESGYAVAVYGFTVALNKEGTPSLMFGNSQANSNHYPIQIEIDEDDNSTIFKVGGATVEFEQNKKTKQIETFVGYKKIRVRARGIFEEGLNFNRLVSSKKLETLTDCLGVIPSGGCYGYKLKDLVHSDALAKGNTFPMKLNIISAEELYVDPAFTARDLNVSSTDGSIIWGVDKNGEVGEVNRISIYNSMTAGFVCEDLGVARLTLCNLYRGTPQLLIISTRNTKTPAHNLQLLPPEDEKMALAYKKAKEEMLFLASEDKSYLHLLKPESVKEFLSEPTKKELPETKKTERTVAEDYGDGTDEELEEAIEFN